MGILKVIFVIFLLLFSFGEVFRFNFGTNVFIKPLDVILIAVFSIWLFGVFRSDVKSIFRDKLLIPIVLFVASMLLSLMLNFNNFSSNEIVVAFFYIARWVLYVSLYFVVKGFSSKFKQKIIYLLLLIGGLFVLFGFIQYFFYSSLRNLYYLGWDEHMYRMFSTFLDPNFAGSFFVLFLVFLSGIFLFFLNNNKIRQIRLIGFMFIFTLVSIYLTYSRSALIMLLVSIFIFSSLIKKRKWTFLIIGVSILFILFSWKNFYIENINLFRIVSAEARIDSAKIALEIIKNNPVFGVGFNTYRYAQVNYGFRDAVGSRSSHADAGTDNSFLFVASTTGIVGLILYLNLLVAILKRAFESYKQYKDKNFQKYMGLIIVASMGGIIANSFFVNSLFYSFAIIWLWILLGLIESN